MTSKRSVSTVEPNPHGTGEPALRISGDPVAIVCALEREPIADGRSDTGRPPRSP